MGGSGGGTGGGPGGGGFAGGGAGGSGASGGGGLDCYQLIFETTVASPDPAVLATLNVGDVCDVQLLAEPVQIAVLTRPDGYVLGGIVNRWADLIRCLNAGVAFEAEILTVTSPVRVHVRPIS